MRPSQVERRSVVGFDGHYEISSDGQVFSLERWCGHYTVSEKVLKQETTRDGYKRVILCKDGVAKKYSVHRLIAEAFIENPHEKPQVNHIDGVKANNVKDNLEWATASENIQHAADTGLIGQPANKISVDIRLAVKAYYVPRSRDRGCVATAKRFGIGKQTVLNIIKEISRENEF